MKTTKMKNHATFTITLEYLEELMSCASGVDCFRDLLPCKISTDPEENIELALEIAARQENDGDYVTWLVGTTRSWNDHILDPDYYPSLGYRFIKTDPLLIMQFLAWVADELTK